MTKGAANASGRDAEAPVKMIGGEQRRKDLIQVLYPSVVGSGLVGLGMQLATFGWAVLKAPDIQLMILAVAFFVGSSAPPKPSEYSYRTRAFACDLVEAVAMFAIFFLLGLFVSPGEGAPRTPISEWNLGWAMVVLSSTTILHVLWDGSVISDERWSGENAKQWWKVRVAVMGLLLLDLGLVTKLSFIPIGDVALHLTFFSLAGIMMLVYLVGDDLPNWGWVGRWKN